MLKMILLAVIALKSKAKMVAAAAATKPLNGASDVLVPPWVTAMVAKQWLLARSHA